MEKFQFAVLILLLFTGIAFGQKLESVYTGLSDKDCKTIKQSNEGAGNYQGMCKGFGGFKLELLEGDIRQTINVVAPNGKKSELNLWTNVSSGFSSVGENAEWRVAKSGKATTPKALILRFKASEDSADSSKITSYLVVVKLSENSACISEIVKPGADQNQKARDFADAAATKPCKTFE